MNDILAYDVTIVNADYYLQTHSTNPLLTSVTITQAIDTFWLHRGDCDTLFGVTPLHVRLWTADGQGINHDPAVLERTQDLVPIFEENSNLYIFDRPTLERTGRRTGSKPLPFCIAREEAWDIDEELDFAVAEFLLARRDT